MDKTLEETFFKAFRKGGAAMIGIEYLEYKYRLATFEDEDECDGKDRIYCTEILPNAIKELTKAFDDSMFSWRGGKRPAIMEEIENNLDECTDENMRERYMFDLLTPFAEWSSFFSMRGIRMKIQEDIEEHRREMYVECNDESVREKRLQNFNRMCESFIKEEEDVRRRYDEATSFTKDGTAEECISKWYKLVYDYANILDAILLIRHTDIFSMQDTAGVWLTGESERDIMSVAFWLGSTQTYVKHLIKGLPTKAETQEDAFSNVDAVNIFNELQEAGWQNEKGKSSSCLMADDLEAFICMLQRKPTEKKMTWIARNPQNRNTLYVQPLYEFLRMVGYADEKRRFEVKEVMEKYFGVEVATCNIKTYRSRYRKEEWSGMHPKLSAIMCKYKK